MGDLFLFELAAGLWVILALSIEVLVVVLP